MLSFGKSLRWLHRWAGLVMAGFLIVVGLTGGLLAFFSELDRWISPHLRVEVMPNTARLTAGELAEHALALAPQAYVTSVYLREIDRVDVAVSPRKNPETGMPFELDFDEILLNPYTGDELGRRTWGNISQGMDNLMSFIYKLHYELALGSFGVWTLGIVALIWTIDCFVGFIITLPKRQRHTSKNAHRTSHFFKRWAKAWKIKTSSGKWRLNFDLHRAAGLWLWMLLLIFAWSSVYMNLYDTVYTGVTRTFTEFHPAWKDLPKQNNYPDIPMRNWNEVNSSAVRLMEKEAKDHGFTVIAPLKLLYQPANGVYLYRVRSTLDMGSQGYTNLYFDAESSQVVLRYFPSHQYSGNTITSWLAALHMGQVFGLPYRILVGLLGVCIAGLSLTGVLVWRRKRNVRALRQ